MFLADLISEEEMIAIDKYRMANISSGNEFAPSKYILREWEKQKTAYLFDLLDNQLILSKDIEYNMNEECLYRQIIKLHDHSFYKNFCKAIKEIPELRWNSFTLEGLFDNINLIANKYSYSNSVDILYDEGKKKISIKKGVRIMPLLSKIADAFNIPDFEDFRLAHSQILNQKKLTGQLSLSIHPLDYMTMSDNDCGWDTCMSWTNSGGYRHGTVEMMNSPMVIVAYLSSKTPYYLNNDEFEWSNKKWRQLFIVNKHLITGIKSYPYTNVELTDIVMNWLRELAQKNLSWSYNDVTTETCDLDSCFDLPEVRIQFDTNMMYNDFCANTDYQIALNKKLGCNNIEIMYSGKSECMVCGDFLVDFDNESSLGCLDCVPACHICENCECEIYELDDVHTLDGYLLCEECWYDNTYLCEVCQEYHHINNMLEINIYTSKEEGLFLKSVFICNDHRCKNEWKNKYLKDNAKIVINEGISIYFDDLIEDTDLWTELKNYII